MPEWHEKGGKGKDGGFKGGMDAQYNPLSMQSQGMWGW